MDQQKKIQIFEQCKLLAEKALQSGNTYKLSKQDREVMASFSDLFEKLDGNITILGVAVNLTKQETTWLIETMVRHHYGLLQE